MPPPRVNAGRTGQAPPPRRRAGRDSSHSLAFPSILVLTLVASTLYRQIRVSLTLTISDGGRGAGDAPCNAVAFREYYQRSFFSDATTTTPDTAEAAANAGLRRPRRGEGVPFGSECLKRLIDADPRDLHLRIAHVRRRYRERMTAINDGGEKTTGDNHSVGTGGGRGDRSRRRRHLFYLCRAKKTCGGLGDRLRGMGRAFYLALGLDAAYGAYVEGGARWDAYFEPAGDDIDFLAEFLERRGWYEEYISDPKFQISEKFALGDDLPDNVTDVSSIPRSVFRRQDDVVVSFRDEMSGKYPHEGTNLTRIMDWEEALFTDPGADVDADADSITFLASNNMLGDMMSNPFLLERFRDYRLEGLSNAELYHIFISLYASVPTEPVVRAAEELWSEFPPAAATSDSSSKRIKTGAEDRRRTYTIGMQVRLGSHDAGVPWERDTKRHSLHSVPCMVRKALDLCNEAKERDESDGGGGVECRAFVTADSASAARQLEMGLRKSMPVISSDLPAVHIDKLRLDPLMVFDSSLGVFVDWYLLANRSDVFVLSRSGFSFMSSIFRNDGARVDFRPAHRMLDDKELYMKKLGGVYPKETQCVFRNFNGTISDEDYFSKEYP